jgi:PTS system nitrogen regulatory IIA component
VTIAFSTRRKPDTLENIMPQSDFDIAALATYLHLAPQQIERLVTRGKLPGRKVGGKWRFSPAEIHHWMEQRIGLADDEELASVEGALSQHASRSGASSPTLVSWLSIETTAIPLPARTKGAVIDAMVQLAATTGLLWDKDKMTDAVRAREELQTTALEGGVALLHPRRPQTSILAEPILALGVTSSGIPFGGGRGLTDVFFLICSTDDRSHLQVLARLSRLISSDHLLDTLREANSPEGAFELISNAEKEIAG